VAPSEKTPDPRLSDVPVWRVGGDGTHDTVVTETLVQVVLNGRVLVGLNCLPDALEDLALGFLASEGLIEGADAVSEVRVSADRRVVNVRAEVDPYRLVAVSRRAAVEEELRVCPSGARFVVEDLLARMKDLEAASALFRETGGVHASAVTDGRTISAFAEDIGRHNAVDKTLGRSLADGVVLSERALLTTGRLNAEIFSKAIRVGVPVVVGRGAVTSRAVELGRRADVTTVGFARGGRMNAYTAPWRLGLVERSGPEDSGGEPE